MKKGLVFILMWLLLAGLHHELHAEQSKAIKVYVNQQEQKYDVNPILHNNTVLVPLRSILTSFGGEIAYSAPTKMITATSGYHIVSLQIDSNKAWFNGIEVELTQPPIAHNGYTYVPLRFIGEAFGASVNWNKTNHSVEILYSKKTSENDPSINTENEAEAFNQLLQRIALHPQNIDEYASHVIFDKRSDKFLKVVMDNGANATYAIQHAIVSGNIVATEYLLNHHLDEIENKQRYTDYLSLHSYTAPEAYWQFYVYLDPNSIHYRTYSPKLSLSTSQQLVELLVKYGIKPSSSDLVRAITSYPVENIDYLSILIKAGADVNGLTTQSVKIDSDERGIRFTSVGDTSYSDELVPIIEIAYRVTSHNPSDYNLKKFSILVEAGAKLEHLSKEQLERMQYLYDGDAQYVKLYEQITKLLEAAKTK